jgi:myo-inositol-hexaphosphate 3-phosphohydrolase
MLSTALEIEPAYATAALPNDPDDPAIWVHPTDPSHSLIMGTMKVAAPAGPSSYMAWTGKSGR